LQPLEPPQRPWQHVTMDFVTSLPVGSSENDALLVLFDRLTKMAHFAPCRTTITVEETARLFIATIVRLHGIPAAIISDRAPSSRQNFGRTRRLGTVRAYNSHPLIIPKWTVRERGQTKRWNSSFRKLTMDPRLEEAGTPMPDIEDFPPQMKVLADELKEVFESIPDGLPPDRAVGHTIPVEPGKLPPFRPLYRFSPVEYEEAKQKIEEFLRKGWIEPSASPYGAPIFFDKKKGGGLRMCVDYRALNKITIKNIYPLPRIEDLFDRLQGAQWFSALDLAQGYHELRITKEDVPKTAFHSPFGHFQWRVLSFGLTNAPAAFQRAMNDVFREAIGHFVLVYLDDILVYSKTEEEHTQYLKWVLVKL
ncbi:hypothetical protein CLOM_g18862, partial [Closterium sp. NIES-68]